MTPPSGTDIRLGRPPPADPPQAAGRVPLFGDTALATRIERAEAQLIAGGNEAARRRSGTAGFLIPLAGGVASCAGDGSPYNKVAGLGFAGAPDPDALSEIEQAFAVFGAGDARPVTPAGIEVRLSAADEAEAWLDVVAEGSVHPDEQGVPGHEEFSREMITEAERDSVEAGNVRYAALRDGILAGGATMRLAQGFDLLYTRAVLVRQAGGRQP